MNSFAIESLSLTREHLCIPMPRLYNDYNRSPRSLFQTVSKKCLKIHKLSSLMYGAFRPITFEVQPTSKAVDEHRELLGYYQKLTLEDILSWKGTKSLLELNLRHSKLSTRFPPASIDTRGCIWKDPRFECPDTIFPNLKSLYVVCENSRNINEQLFKCLRKWNHVENVHLRLIRSRHELLTLPITDMNLSNLVELVITFSTIEVANVNPGNEQQRILKLLKNLSPSIRRFRLEWRRDHSAENNDQILKEAERILSDRFPHLQIDAGHCENRSSNSLLMCGDLDSRENTHLEKITLEDMV